MYTVSYKIAQLFQQPVKRKPVFLLILVTFVQGASSQHHRATKQCGQNMDGRNVITCTYQI